MRNIFIVITEHHVAMALAIIYQENLSDNTIVFSTQIKRPINGNFFDELEKAKEDFNIKLVYVDEDLPSKYILYKPLWRRLYFRGVYKKIRTVVEKGSLNIKFFVFADQDPVTQFTVNEYSKYEINLVQDGFAQYIKHNLTNRSLKTKQRYYKWIFGDFWKQIKHFGDYHSYNSLYVLYPDLVESRYKSLNLKHVSLDNFYNPKWQNFSKRLILKEFPDFFDLKNKDAIVFLPRLKNNDEVNLVVSNLLEFCKQKSIKRLCFKNHPRSTHRLSKVDFVESCEISSALPAECMFAFNKEVKVNYYIPLSTLVVVGTHNAKKEQINIVFGNSLNSTNINVLENKELSNFLQKNTVFHN